MHDASDALVNSINHSRVDRHSQVLPVVVARFRPGRRILVTEADFPLGIENAHTLLLFVSVRSQGVPAIAIHANVLGDVFFKRVSKPTGTPASVFMASRYRSSCSWAKFAAMRGGGRGEVAHSC